MAAQRDAASLASELGCDVPLAAAALKVCHGHRPTAAKVIKNGQANPMDPYEYVEDGLAPGPVHGDSVFKHPWVQCLLHAARDRVKLALDQQTGPEEEKWLICIRTFGRPGVRCLQSKLQRLLQSIFPPKKRAILEEKLKAAELDLPALKKLAKKPGFSCALKELGISGIHDKTAKILADKVCEPLEKVEKKLLNAEKGLRELTLAALELALGPKAYQHCLIFVSPTDSAWTSGRYTAALSGTPWADRIVVGVRGAHLQAQRQALPDRPVVVVSAMGKTTNALLSAARSAVETGEVDVSAIRRGDERIEMPSSMGELLSELEKILNGEISTQTRDRIVSFGERLSVRAFAAAFNHTKSQEDCTDDLFSKDASRPVDAWQIGMRTTSGSGSADSAFSSVEILEETFGAIRHFLGPLKHNYSYIPIDSKGVITTLGRDGSDLTATVIGAALKAAEVQIWKDVSGVQTTDPRVISSAKPVRVLTFEEAAELSTFGTRIVPKLSDGETRERRVAAISSKSNITMIVIKSSRMLGQHGYKHVDVPALERELQEVAKVSVLHNVAMLTLIVPKSDSVSVLRESFAAFEESGLEIDSSQHDWRSSDVAELRAAVLELLGKTKPGTFNIFASKFCRVEALTMPWCLLQSCRHYGIPVLLPRLLCDLFRLEVPDTVRLLVLFVRMLKVGFRLPEPWNTKDILWQFQPRVFLAASKTCCEDESFEDDTKGDEGKSGREGVGRRQRSPRRMSRARVMAAKRLRMKMLNSKNWMKNDEDL
eukprot:Skav206015  [mRNA]  locus=scaffold3015:35476:55835:+ [translate_table: standard]